MMNKLEYLGHEIKEGGVKPSTRKIDDVSFFHVPGNVQFLELASYFRKFVKYLSSISKILTMLTKMGANFEWFEDQQRAFEMLKKRLFLPFTIRKRRQRYTLTPRRWGLVEFF